MTPGDAEFDEAYFSRAYIQRSWLKGKKPFYFRRLKACVRRYVKTGRLLDYGCGLGYWLRAMEGSFETHGSDISRFAIEQARRHAPRTKFDLLEGDRLPYPDDFFDVVTAFDVLEHIPRPEDSLAELARVARPGSVLIVSVPNLASIGRKWKGKQWVNYRDPTHRSLLGKEAWLARLREAHYRAVDSFVDGLYDSPYIPGVPAMLQHFIFKVPVTLLFGLGVRFPERLGESLILVARKE